MSKSRWIAFSRPNPQAALRLFCFPFAGGGATTYRSWMSALPPSVELCPVELPGRGSRIAEPPHTRLETLIPELAAGLQPYLERPFVLFGHSMGALISFELARYLRDRHGKEPLHLFLSAHRAPQHANSGPLTHTLPEAELLEKLRDLEGTPPEILAHQELMALLLPIIRADFELCERYAYSPAPPLASPISVFGGLQDQQAGREALEGWRVQTTGTFTLRLFAGGHFYLLNQQTPLLGIMAQELAALSHLL